MYNPDGIFDCMIGECGQKAAIGHFHCQKHLDELREWQASYVPEEPTTFYCEVCGCVLDGDSQFCDEECEMWAGDDWDDDEDGWHYCECGCNSVQDEDEWLRCNKCGGCLPSH